MFNRATFGVLFAVLCYQLHTHERQPHVLVNTRFEQTDNGLDTLVRAPLATMRDIDLPLTSSASLDLSYRGVVEHDTLSVDSSWARLNLQTTMSIIFT